MKLEVFWRRKVFVLCWLAYASAYLCRTNLAIVLPLMKAEFHWNNAMVGLFGSAFFWAYAIGQLINGWIGDKINPKYFIATGLLGTASINLFVGIFHQVYFMLIVWALNGFVLATLWGPIVRISAAWFPPSRRTKLAVGLALSMIGGYVLSWGLVGVVIQYTSWEWGFFVPAAFTGLYALLFLRKMVATPKSLGFEDYSHGEENAPQETVAVEVISLPSLIIEERLWLIAVTCVVQGIIKEGITLWTPSFLSDQYHLRQSAVSLMATIVPLVSIMGIFLAGWLNVKWQGKEKKPLVILLGMTMISCFFLYVMIGRFIILDIILLGSISALLYGANMLLLTMIPLRYAKYQKASGVTGFLDFSVYLGAGLSGFLTGWLIDGVGWSMMTLLWAGISLVGIVGVLWAYKKPHSEVVLGNQ